MKRILINITLLGLVLFAINFTINTYLLPFTWGDKDLHVKTTYYEKHKEDYTALFIGGSLEFRHLNPEITDSLCHLYGVEFHSFNAGSDGVAYLKQVRVLEQVLKDPSPNLKYAFLSISSTTRFKYLNLHTKRFASWMRPKDMVRSIQLTWELKLSLKEKLKYTWYYFITMMENGYHIGLLTDAIQYLTHPEEAYEPTCLGAKKNGFLPYDDQEQLTFDKDTWEERMQDMMLLSRKVYIEKVGRRDSMLLKNIDEFEHYDDKYVLKSMLKTYNKMIKACEKKGIQLIIIMPPRGPEPYTHLIPTFLKLPEKNKISLASPIEYPELYLPENSYNFYHLNLKGATLYSKIFANRFLELQGIQLEESEFDQ